MNSRLKGLYNTKSSTIQVKKRHAVKALLVVCLVTGLILGVYCQKGRVHDFALFQKSRLTIHPAIKILADLGFLGLAKLHPNSVLPFKKAN